MFQAYLSAHDRRTFACSIDYPQSLYSVQFSSRLYLCAWKSPYAPHPVSQTFPHYCLWNSSNVRLTDDWTLSDWTRPFKGARRAFPLLLRLSTPGDLWCDVLSFVCSQKVSQVPQHFRSSETQTTGDGCFTRQSICSCIPLDTKTPAKYTDTSLWRRGICNSVRDRI